MVDRILRNGHDVGKWLVGTGNRNMRVVGYGWQDIQRRASVKNMVGRIFRNERVVRTWSAGYSGTEVVGKWVGSSGVVGKWLAGYHERGI
jgi:hypothetical protein